MWQTQLYSGEWVSDAERDRRIEVAMWGSLIFVFGLLLATFL